MLSFKSNKLKMLELRKVDESKIEDLYQVIHKCAVQMNDKKRNGSLGELLHKRGVVKKV